MIRRLVFLLALIAPSVAAQTTVLKGSADVTRYYMLRDSAAFTPETGVTITGLDMQYTRDRSTAATKVDATALSAANDSHADNQCIEVDGTSSPGLYRCDWPDAAFATGADKVVLCITGTGFDPACEEIQLVDYDPEDGVRLGLTALPNAAADAAGGLPISDDGGFDVDAILETIGSPSDFGSGTSTIAANLEDLADNGTASYDRSTDSLQAIRDRGDTAWTTGSGTGLTALASGTAQAGTSTTIQLASAETFANSELNYNVVCVNGGTGDGQCRLITGYVSSTDTATISPAWTTNPSSDSTYEVTPGSAFVALMDSDTITASVIATSAIGEPEIEDTAEAALTVTATEIRSAVGLSSANLDTQLTTIDDFLDTEVAAILADTDVIGTPAGADISADIAAVKAETALIVADTNELQTDDIPGTLGAPAGASVSADIAAVKAETALIVADTNELQTDDIPGTLGTPAGADIAADIAAVKAETASILTDTGTTLDDLVDDLEARLGTPSDFGSGTSTIAANLQDLADNGTASYDRSTESLQALRDRGDAAWTTGAGGTPPQLLQNTTIATLSTQTSFTLTAGSEDDDAYNGAVAVVTDQSTATQKAYGTVDDYTGLSKTVTLSADPGIFTMAAGDTIDIMTPLGSAGSAPTAGQVADAVWDESTSGHTTGGTFGEQAKTDIDAILADTNELQVDDTPGALTALDGKIDTIDDFLDTEVAAILADTGELQADWVDGGRLDLILDARASQASVDAVDDFVDTEVAAILADTNELQVDDTPSALAAIDAKIDIIDGNVDDIETDTGTTLQAELDGIQADTEDLQTQIGTAGDGLTAIPMADIAKNSALSNFSFQMLDETDFQTPETGLTVTGQLSCDGGAFGAVSGPIAEIANGWYQFDAAAGDTNCDFLIWRFTASGAAASSFAFSTK